MNPIELKTKVTHNADMMTSWLDDELVMMDADEGRYFSLNPTSSRIWTLIEQPKSVSELCDELMELYSVDRQSCETQVIKVLSDLQQQGLVSVQA